MNDSLLILASVAAGPQSVALVALPGAIAVAVAATVWLVGRGTQRRIERDDESSEGIFGPLTSALAAQIPESRKEAGDFRRLVRGAGLYQPHALTSIYALRFVLLFVPLVATGIAAIAAPSKHTLAIVVGGGLVAACLSIAPRLYVFFRRRQRAKRIGQALPGALEMLSMCAGGGVALEKSLDTVASQLVGSPELAAELRILGKQSAVGSLQQALADLAQRVDLPEIRQLSAVLTRSERMGTRLAGNLLGQADHLRTMRRQQATLRANKAPVKLVFPLMFCFAPAAVIVLCSPAMLELKEFLAPSKGQSVFSTQAGSAITASAVVQTLEELNQELVR